MDEAALEAALQPVREHHKAASISPNTVLAAHIRALGANPVGPVWSYAKFLLAGGHDFAEAAREAVTGAGADDDAEPEAGASTTEAEPAAELVPPTGVIEGKASMTRRTHVPYYPPGDGSMQWFPKVFGPGDIDGKGAARLLGTPNVPLSTVLVRETAQNSWDARLGHRPLVFTLHLRYLTQVEKEVLRHRIFTGPGDGLALAETLRRSQVRVLEVSDRGTKGLGGPVRNDVVPPIGSATNYIDLVLNVGAPRDVHLGGGTYGFGKTISYRVSGSGTVLMWSRTFHDGRIDDRLIGSAIGESFARNGARHTGRHWWGSVRDEGTRVEPWTGEDAAVLAGAVFDAAFEGDETGTSLMIIDPFLGGEDDADDIARLSDAVLWNLWPKLLADSQGKQPMRIEIYHEGNEVELPELHDHPLLAGYAEALQLVRATQDGTTFTPQFNSKVLEVRCHKPATLVGHLAFTKFPAARPDETASRDTVPVSAPTQHVAWMRHDAELVVRYDERGRLDSDVLQWAAVFKPVEEHDDRFASAEPPAHDDWVPASIEERNDKVIVNVGLRRIRELIGAELAPPAVLKQSEDNSTSVAALADSLSRLIGGVAGSKPMAAPKSSGGGGSRARRPQPHVLEWDRGLVAGGRRTYKALVAVKDASEPRRVRVDVGVATDGPRMYAEDMAHVVGWARSRGEMPNVPLDEPFAVHERRWLHIEAAADVGIDLSLSCEEV